MAELAGMVNRYICSRGHVVNVILYCDGVTPYTMECREPGCGCTSYSQFYRVPQRDTIMAGPYPCIPTWEWRLPTRQELKIYKGNTLQQVKQHLQGGGLMCFPVSNETLIKYGFKSPPVDVDAVMAKLTEKDKPPTLKPDADVMGDAKAIFAVAFMPKPKPPEKPVAET